MTTSPPILPILTYDATPEDDPGRVVSPPAQWAPKLAALRALFADGEGWLVAFSGGIDSAFVLRVAAEVLGSRAVAMTAISPSLPEEERAAAVDFAAGLGVPHLLVDSREFEVEGYFENPRNRCYFCKTEVYGLARAQARLLGLDRIADGVNVDDLGDHRPGLRAAREQGVRHPLIEVGLTKADIRGAARGLGMPLWHKPAFACLASRFPTGTTITEDRIAQVAQVERMLRAEGFRQVRVRYHGARCSVEVLRAELPRLDEPVLRERLTSTARTAGFAEVVVDPRGYRMGAVNARSGDA